MALTMTRARTQETLTKLVEMIANIHGELEFLAGLAKLTPEELTAMDARRAELYRERDALYATLKHFNPALDPEDIGTTSKWMKQFGRKPTHATKKRYLAALAPAEPR